ncbi:protease modulator HflC, partial [bacterium]|nr:protease modulator HflC [bacterium]
MTGKKLLTLIVAALVVIALISSVTFTVDETQSAIVTRFGRPVGDVLGPGLHFKAPWPVDRVLRMDARLLVFDNEPMEMLTNDKKNVLIDSFLT